MLKQCCVQYQGIVSHLMVLSVIVNEFKVFIPTINGTIDSDVQIEQEYIIYICLLYILSVDKEVRTIHLIIKGTILPYSV